MFFENIFDIEPWEKNSTGIHQLKSGIHLLSNNSSIPICLQITNSYTNKCIELCCDINKKEYAYFQNGSYEISIIVGSRDYEIEEKKIQFTRLSFFEKSLIYVSKAFSLLRDGNGIKYLLTRLISMLFSKNSFGINADNSDTILENTLCSHELKVALSPFNDPTKFTSKIGILCEGKEIYASLKDKLGLKKGANIGFITSNVEECEYILEIGEDDSLVEDAYFQVCRAITKHTSANFIILDKWIDKIPTAFPAFDPMLFQRLGYSIPLLRKSGYVIDYTAQWKDIENKFAKYSAPIAISSKINKPAIVKKSRNNFKTSIIIPTRDKANLLEKCLNSIFITTNDSDFEIIIINNGSIEPETYNLFDKHKKNNVRIINADFEFNFSKLCNLGAKSACGNLLIFVNNDIEFITNGWLRSIEAIAENKNIGAIGARLWYDNDTLQHCGVYMGVNDACGHVFANLSREKINSLPILYFNSLRSAVTGAFLAITKDKFDEIGGFDEEQFAIAFNDIDLCLKLLSNGYYNCICNDIDAIHHETQSRIKDTHISQHHRYNCEKSKFIKKWDAFFDKDRWLPRIINTSSTTPRFK